ncbi:MAG: YdcF family protein [Spirochaetes bacterium]|nr:YdcF family protein [Spirochaetota bacterium]
MPRVLSFLAVVSIVTFTSISLAVYLYGKKVYTVKADAAIVLGAAAWGNKPSPVFRERINHAIELYEKKQVKYIIFTGGKGFPGEAGESIIAKQYSIKHGVPENRIFVENYSQNTEENIQYASLIALNYRFKKFYLVSDPYHLLRASLIAKKFGLEVYPSATPTSMYRSRETKFLFIFKESYLIALFYFSEITGKDFYHLGMKLKDI